MTTASAPRPRSRLHPAWKFTLALLAGGVLGGFFGAALARFAPQGLPRFQAWDIAGLLGVWFGAILIHEGGHWLGGRIAGMRLLLMTVGPIRLTRDADGWRWSAFLRAGSFGGLTVMAPDPDRPIAPQLLPMIAGGPLASLLLALAGLGLALAGDGRLMLYGAAVAALSGFLFAITAVPRQIGGFLNDAARWRELRRGGAAAEQQALLGTLVAQSLAGRRPRALDAGLLERARELDDGSDPLRSATLHFLAYSMACDRGDVTTAAAALDAVAERAEAIPQGLRQAFAIELAYFQAAHRNDAPGARAWLERARGGLVEPSIHARTAAALALAEGRHDDARAALAKAEATLPRYYDRGGAHLLADQVRALRERLAAR